MWSFFYIVKIIAILQFIVICFLLMLAYGVKAYSNYIVVRNKRISKELECILIDNINDFNIKNIMHYKQYILLIIPIITRIDASVVVEKWTDIRRQIIDTLVLPKARVLAGSRAWTKRYLACQSFQLSLKYEDEDIIKRLISDPIPLVALNAAILAIHYNSQSLLDAVIDSFSKSRRLNQSLYAQVLSTADVNIIPLIKHRLKHEPNSYTKAFCYRTLTSLPFISETVETTNEDLNSTNIDLKLAVLAYLRHTDPTSSTVLFLRYLKDSDWEVRAKAAKLLGEIGAESSAEALETCLKDQEWWVRINAAEALAKLGPKGFFILKRQDATVDQFAYDTAAQILSINSGELVP